MRKLSKQPVQFGLFSRLLTKKNKALWFEWFVASTTGNCTNSAAQLNAKRKSQHKTIGKLYRHPFTGKIITDFRSRINFNFIRFIKFMDNEIYIFDALVCKWTFSFDSCDEVGNNVLRVLCMLVVRVVDMYCVIVSLMCSSAHLSFILKSSRPMYIMLYVHVWFCSNGSLRLCSWQIHM